MQTKKKRKNDRKQLRCPYCGSAMTLRPACEIYPDDAGDRRMYVCSHYPECNTYVGTHAGTLVPLGIPANGDLRNLRIRAHKVFDQIWKSGIMTRDQAYRWMADVFCLKLKDAHIGCYSEYQCNELIRKCEGVLARNQRVRQEIH
jgi:ssDNA-binding Zn-finger/Zn-ribbon topoisomerase 1